MNPTYQQMFVCAVRFIVGVNSLGKVADMIVLHGAVGGRLQKFQKILSCPIFDESNHNARSPLDFDDRVTFVIHVAADGLLHETPQMKKAKRHILTII